MPKLDELKQAYVAKYGDDWDRNMSRLDDLQQAYAKYGVDWDCDIHLPEI